MQKRILLSRLVTAAWLACCGAGLLSAQEEGTHWLDNYKDAIQEAKRTQKPIFLEFRCEA